MQHLRDTRTSCVGLAMTYGKMLQRAKIMEGEHILGDCWMRNSATVSTAQSDALYTRSICKTRRMEASAMSHEGSCVAPGKNAW